MFRGFILALAFGATSAAWSETASTPDSSRRPMGQLKKSISLTLSAIHTSAVSVEDRKLREAAIREGVGGVIASFFLESLLDDTVSMETHSALVHSMWQHLQAEISKHPELVLPGIATIFVDEIDKTTKEVKSSSLRKRSELVDAYGYSVGQTMLLEVPARGLWFLGLKGAKSFKRIRSGEKWYQSGTWSDWNLKRDWNSWRDSRAQDRNRMRAPRTLGGLCRRALQSIGDRRKWLFVARHLVIGAAYSVPNYFFEYRPFFWGFNNYEPWDFSEDLIRGEMRPYFAKFAGSKK